MVSEFEGVNNPLPLPLLPLLDVYVYTWKTKPCIVSVPSIDIILYLNKNYNHKIVKKKKHLT